jgi:hypothetical protein
MVSQVGNNLRLNRNQIKDVVGSSPRAIKQFESLFRDQNGASPTYTVRSADASGAIESSDYLVLVDTTAGAVTINLPTALSSQGRELVFKKIDAVANAMTIEPDGAETIDGAANVSTTTQWAVYRVMSDGTAWFTV